MKQTNRIRKMPAFSERILRAALTHAAALVIILALLFGNTTIAQWIKDLSTGEWTMISKYDLGVKNVVFTGDNAIFLENFGPATAGEVRTMEVKNARVHGENGSWVPVNSGVFMLGYEHAGSYKYGTEDDTFWMITTGVTGKAGEPQQPILLTVPGGEEGEP